MRKRSQKNKEKILKKLSKSSEQLLGKTSSKNGVINNLATLTLINPEKLPYIDIGEKPKNFAMSIHSVTNIYSRPDTYSLFSDPEETANSYSKQYGIGILNHINKAGIDLNDFQFKVFEGILKAFKHSAGEGYKGNIPAKEKKELIGEGKYDTLPSIYNNIINIPRVRLNQSELFELTGIKENSIAERERVIEALNYLGSIQFLFSYKRLSYDDKGKPEMNIKGEYKKEEVTAIDTLFTIKTVRDTETNIFKYYEIEPTATLLDQADNYFLLIPHHWREEVKQIMGGKEVSSYTMRFLLWLRLQFEEKRRKHFKTFEIKMDWEGIAKTLNMPYTIYKRNKKRANTILLTAYNTAVETGYLISYKREPHIDILTLNESKYFTPAKPDEKVKLK